MDKHLDGGLNANIHSTTSESICQQKRACINACVIEKGLSPVRDIDPSGCGSIDEHAKLDRNATEKRGDPPAADAEWRRRQVAAAWRRDERHRNRREVEVGRKGKKRGLSRRRMLRPPAPVLVVASSLATNASLAAHRRVDKSASTKRAAGRLVFGLFGS